LLVDTRQGITIDACARVNREIGDMIERESLIGESYTLEVSSPGLDRPLREKKDFQRLLGRSVKVWPMQEGRPCEPVTGVIETVGENGITLTSRERTLRFDFKDIFKAKQAMEF
jgi:ribosome maturation factor RimP